MHSSASPVVLMVSLLAGCAGAPTPTPDAPPDAELPAQVVVSAHLPPPLSIDGLTVHLDDGTRHWTVRGEELVHASGNVWRGAPQGTARHGSLQVRFVLEGTDGTVASSGGITLSLKPDWIHGVDIHAATEDPRRYCFGCQGSVRFELDPVAASPAADAIYVVWGGNSISSPVVY